jgi:hypothetical protein
MREENRWLAGRGKGSETSGEAREEEGTAWRSHYPEWYRL